jgi:mono/diheme cytochrome c family protein
MREQGGDMMKTIRATMALGVLVAVLLAVSQPYAQGSIPSGVRMIFNDKCVKCHGGSNPSAGLDLTTNTDVEGLVGKPAAEKPSTSFIDPGQPQDSYLFMKVEGASGIIGGRMPLTGGSLSEAQLQTIHDWIAGMDGSGSQHSQQSSSSRQASGGQGSSGAQESVDQLFDGAYIYQVRCSTCHGRSGEGVSLFAPPLAGDAYLRVSSDRSIGDVIQMGRKYRDKHYPAYSGMPRFQFLTGGELQALIDYLKGPLQAGR